MRVAVVDTGVEFRHPHVARPLLGCDVRVADGSVRVTEGECADFAGHGTCVAARILELCPDAEIDAIRAAGADLRARAEDLAAAIEIAVARGARIVNVSLGTPDLRFASRLHDAVLAAVRAGARVVAAAPEGGRRILPAGLPDVIAVGAGEGTTDVVVRPEGFPRLLAPGDARPFPGQRANFHGPSLAAAFVTARLARGEEVPG
jgi:subtilisin family serine protease